MRHPFAGCLLAAALVACSSNGTPSPGAAPTNAGAGGGHTPAPARPSPGASGSPSAGLGPTPSPDVPGGGDTSPAPGTPSAGGRSASPTPTTNEPPTIPRDVPTEATVSPSCVRPGGRVTLTVVSEPAAGVAYQAVYADGAGGAASPWGAGYGGNDKGHTDGRGRYVASWVVATNAPPGHAHVDVVIGAHGKFGYDDPVFEVGPC